MKTHLRKSALTLAIVASLGMSGCLKDDSEPTAETVSTSRTTTGVITGFGSVFINGVEYETDNASINVDGVANAVGDDSGLKLGMVVTLSGDSTGANGNALSIEFEDEVEGMVTEVPVDDGAGNITGALKIMGVTINYDEDTVFESSDANIDMISNLAIGNMVEVSGYSSGDGIVWATRLELKNTEKQAGDEVELKGLVTGLDETAMTFMIGDMLISYSVDVLDEDIATLANDMLVEVKSLGEFDTNNALISTEVELKSEDKKSVDHDADDDEVELEGVVTAEAVNSVFDVNGVAVTFDANTQFVHGTEATIVVGLKVKVEGEVDATSGDFIAEKVVFKPTGDLEMEGALSSADAANNSITLFGQTVKLTNTTMVEDDRDRVDNVEVEPVKYLFGADDLSAGDWVSVKAYKNSLGELVATKMERENTDSEDLAELEGKIDSIDATNSALMVVSGVSVDLGTFTGGDAATLVVGDKVEIEGSFDETTQVFTALDEVEKSDDEHYIGGDDAEEESNSDDSSSDDNTSDDGTDSPSSKSTDDNKSDD